MTARPGYSNRIELFGVLELAETGEKSRLFFAKRLLLNGQVAMDTTLLRGIAVLAVCLLAGITWIAHLRRRSAAMPLERRIHLLAPHNSMSLEKVCDLLGDEHERITEFVVLAAPNATGQDQVWIQLSPTTAKEFEAILVKLRRMADTLESEADRSGEFRLISAVGRKRAA